MYTPYTPPPVLTGGQGTHNYDEKAKLETCLHKVVDGLEIEEIVVRDVDTNTEVKTSISEHDKYYNTGIMLFLKNLL